MLRHCEEIHTNDDPDVIELGMKVVSRHRTAFERQLTEAVMIDESNGKYLMNRSNYQQNNYDELFI